MGAAENPAAVYLALLNQQFQNIRRYAGTIEGLAILCQGDLIRKPERPSAILWVACDLN